MTDTSRPRSSRNTPFLCGLLLSSILASGFAIPALAQSASGLTPPPPVRRVVDENGVDVIRGTFNVRFPGISVGTDESGLSYQSENMGDGFVSTVRSGIIQSGSTYIITIGGSSDSFTLSGGVFTATEGNGATLTRSGSDYTYTSPNGTSVLFRRNLAGATAYWDAGFARALSVTTPSGAKTTFTYKEMGFCPGGMEGGICPSGNKIALRLSSVTNSNGYQLKFAYQNNTINELVPGQEYTNWASMTNVRALNNANEYCNPAADSCTFANSWPILTFGGSSTATSQTTTTTDALNRISAYTTNLNGSGTVTSYSFQRPGAAAPNITATPVLTAGGYRIGSITNEGLVFSYNYADAGNLRTTTVADANGGVRTYIGDTNTYRLLSYKDELNRTTSYTYDANGRVTRITSPEGNYVEYTYDTRGNVVTTTNVAKAGSGLANIVTSAAYPAACTNTKICNQPTSMTDAKGFVTDYTYDATHGGTISVTAPAPVAGGTRPQTRYTYSSGQAYYKNSGGSIVASGQSHTVLSGISACQTTASCAGVVDESKTTIAYGPQTAGTANNLLPISATAANGAGTVTSTNTVTYDTVGNVLTVDGPLAGTADTTRARYDTGRQVVGVIGPDPDGAGTRKHLAQRMTYNNDGQVTNVEIGNVNSQSDADWNGMTVSQNTTTTYDTNARPVRQELKSGGTTYSQTQANYDALGRVNCVATRMDSAIWASQTDACTPQTTNATFGPDRVSKRSYNAASEVIQVQTAVGTADQSNEVSKTFSNNGRVLTVTDAENNRTAYEYDGFDRAVKTRYPDGTKGSLTSSTTDFQQATFDANSNITQSRLRDGQLINLTYDRLNRVTLKDLPGTEQDVSYSYDLFNRMTQASQTGNVLGFQYDALSRNTLQSGPHGNIDYTYDAGGRRLTTVYPGGTALTINYDYDVIGNVSRIRENGATTGVGVLATYTFDNLGRRTGITRGNGSTSSYTYDAVSRLASIGSDLGGTTYDQTTTFAYNPAGQINTLSKSNDIYAWNGHYNVDRVSVGNGLNQLKPATPGGDQTSVPTLNYDGRGNLTTSGTNGYTYSSENMLLTGPSSATLGYDPALRLYQSVGGGVTTRMQYDGNALIAEYNGTNVLQRRYIHGPGSDEPLLWYEGGGLADRRWFHSDERGSVVAVTDGSGTVLGTNRYDEYGIPQSNNYSTRFSYTGQTWLSVLGMYYYKARIYSPTLGRFMQSDPIGYGDGMNMYNYVKSDPVNFNDPLGLAVGMVPTPQPPSRPNGRECPGICVTGSRPTSGGNPAAGLGSGGRGLGSSGNTANGVSSSGNEDNNQCSAENIEKLLSNPKVADAIAKAIELSEASKTAGAPDGPETGFWTGNSAFGNFRVSTPYSTGYPNAIDVAGIDAIGNGILYNKLFLHLHIEGGGLSPNDRQLAGSITTAGGGILSFNLKGEATGCAE